MYILYNEAKERKNCHLGTLFHMMHKNARVEEGGVMFGCEYLGKTLR